jgi:hypothetical protein
MLGRDSLVGGSAAVDDDIALNRAVVQVEAVASVVDVGTPRARATKLHFPRDRDEAPAVYSGASTAIGSLQCYPSTGGTALTLVASMP